MELKEIYKPIEKDLVEVKEEIRRQLGEEDGLMKRVIEDIIESSGKLLRPVLALLTFSAGNDNRKNKNSIIKAASIIELIHTATLIHDDVIDGTTLRRIEQIFIPSGEIKFLCFLGITCFPGHLLCYVNWAVLKLFALWRIPLISFVRAS